jgi:hypothetical protein
MMSTTTRLLDPEMRQFVSVMETARPHSWWDNINQWFSSLAGEIESSDTDFDPMIDFPRDL